MGDGEENFHRREIRMNRTGEDVRIDVTVGGVSSAVTLKIYELEMALSLRANNGSYFGSQLNDPLIGSVLPRRKGLHLVK